MAVIALALAAFFLYHKPVQPAPTPQIDASIRDSIQNCLEIGTKEAVKEFKLSGGLPNPPINRESLYSNGRYITYYKIGGQVVDIPQKEYEGSLGNFIESVTYECLNTIMADPEYPTVSTGIDGDNLFVMANIPYKVIAGNQAVNLNPQYSLTAKLNSSKFIEAVKYYAKRDQQNLLDLTTLGELGDQGIYTTNTQINPNVTVILLQKDGDTFQFAIKE